MKAMVLTAPGKLEVQNIEIREPVRDEVVVKVMACGICGTDLHIYHGEEGAAKNPFPIVLGHEFSGVIEKVGPEVQNLKVGDRVAVDPNCTCGQCYYCLNGMPHFCEHMTCYGTVSYGGFAEKCIVREKAAYTLPENVSFAEGAMMEPVSCCLHGIDLCEIRPGDTVAVIGCGPIGQIILQLARTAGASKVIAIEPVAAKRELALKLGADIALDPIGTDVQETLLQKGVQYIDKVIECVGNKHTMQDAIHLVSNGGTVMLFGLTSPDDELTIHPFTDLFKKEIKITASYINPLTSRRVVNLIAAHRLDLDALITDKLSLEDAPTAFTDNSYRAHGKILVLPNG
jgi:Threonine dehydrogenase and related Zn-dependent dehydrogenases